MACHASRRLVTCPMLRPCQTQPFLVASTGAPSAPSSSVLEAESCVEKPGRVHNTYMDYIIEGSLEAKLPTIWTDEKQSREEAERRDRSEEKRSEERRCRCEKR